MGRIRTVWVSADTKVNMNPQCLLCRSFCKRSYPRPCLLMAAACNDPSVWIISDQMKTSISIIIIKVCLYFCSVGSFSSLNLWLQQETRSWWFSIKHWWICVTGMSTYCTHTCVWAYVFLDTLMLQWPVQLPTWAATWLLTEWLHATSVPLVVPEGAA